MTRRDAIVTTDAPAALGPYSQGIVTDGHVYCSGQLGLDPATATLPTASTRSRRSRSRTSAGCWTPPGSDSPTS